MAVTLEQAKEYLRIDSDLTEDDEFISSLIEAYRLFGADYRQRVQ